MYGPNVGGGGLGRYVEQLVVELQRHDRENRYVLFLKPENFDACRADAPNVEKRVADAHWYTAKEQALMPRLIAAESLDLMHFPHWNVPLLCRTPFVATIHDLILLEQPLSARATTRHPAVFALKRAGYNVVLRHAVRSAKRIIVPSAYVKTSISTFFPSSPREKISVVHEGVTDLSDLGTSHAPTGSPYLLYVGNAYPHKNLETLLRAFSKFVRMRPDARLVLAGRDDAFYKRLRSSDAWADIPDGSVRFAANPSDADLADLYRGAALYLFPSRSEGFGLPPLEAMSMGVPVAAARATALPEILGDAAIYFSPDDAEEMAAVMDRAVADAALRAQLVARGHARVRLYSWSDMARQTMEIYRQLWERP
jgi:glycosyltransferase involved in cell wall biosynthesis